MKVRVLTVNSGSTSLKLAVVVDGLTVVRPATLEAALAEDAPDCVAHRIVHGGRHDRAVVVDDESVTELWTLVDLAPLHQPPALDALERCRAAWPEVPNIACFDTAFHATMPAAARTYALPARYRETVRVYGFHGLSFAWVASRMRAVAPTARRVLIAHLGGGQSLCGTLDGRSVVTTMGMTPVDGLVMGTRCGSLDPGAVLWLGSHLLAGDDLDRLLDGESGLVGLCGTADMRTLHARVAAGDQDARLAFDVWRHRIVTLSGACAAALGGLDALVFTGGIGENDPVARGALVDGLAWLGIAVDERPDAPGDREVTAAGSSVRSFIIAAREDLQLAAEAQACLHQERTTHGP